MYHDLCLGGKSLAERENMGFDLTKSNLCPILSKPYHKGCGSSSGGFPYWLNPFGCAKLTTFAVMCKAYGCEPSVDLFRGFFNLFPGGEWLTFAKRPEKHIPNLMPKVITRIEGWKGQFFFFQDSIVHVGCPKLLSKDNWWDTKYFGDKLLDRIHENPFFQRLGRYPANVRVFLDPILFLAGLKPSWEYGQQRPVILLVDKRQTRVVVIYIVSRIDKIITRGQAKNLSSG
ncbi:hypothetical protein Tco_0412760 [Tanacetum coccineum]